MLKKLVIKKFQDGYLNKSIPSLFPNRLKIQTLYSMPNRLNNQPNQHCTRLQQQQQQQRWIRA